jgi:hypothetical protein
MGGLEEDAGPNPVSSTDIASEVLFAIEKIRGVHEKMRKDFLRYGTRLNGNYTNLLEAEKILQGVYSLLEA